MLNIITNNLKIITWISLNSLTILALLKGGPRDLVITSFIAIIVSYILIFRKNILAKVELTKDKNINILSIVFVIASCILFYQEFVNRYTVSKNFQDYLSHLSFLIKPSGALLSLLSFFVIFLFWNWFFNGIGRDCLAWLNKLKIEEKIFLITFSFIFSLFMAVVFFKTSLFYYPEANGEKIMSNILFTTDSGGLYLTNVFANMSAGENDIRHPLFALFAMPMAVSAYILSKILGFINDAYALALQILQIIMLGVTVILLANLLQLKTIKEKVCFYLFLSSSYSFLFWTLVVEQYIVCYFFVIVFISNFNNGKYKKLLYVGATGTLITSGALFPLLFERFDIKKIIRDMFKIGICFMCIMLLTSQTVAVLGSVDSIITLSQFTGIGVTFTDRFYQFLNFVSLCLVVPKTTLIEGGGVHISIQLAAVFESANILGIIILGVVSLGFWLNKKNKFAQICYGWVAFSFLILCIVGWGSAENGMILYGLYFSWAYICLIYIAMKEISLKLKLPSLMIFIPILTIVMFYYNGLGLNDIINFGVTYYPK